MGEATSTLAAQEIASKMKCLNGHSAIKMLKSFSLPISFWLLVIVTGLGGSGIATLPLATDPSNRWTGLPDKMNQVRLENTSLTAESTLWYIRHSEADHQNQIILLIPQGYRLVSLQMTDVSPPLYNAVWNMSPGPLQQTTVGLSGQDFDNWFNFWADQGYVPTIMTGTGYPTVPGASVVYAAVMEKKAIGSFFLLRDQTFTNLISADKQQVADGRKMIHISQYGDPFGTMFTGIWHDNPHYEKASWFGNYAPGTATDPANSELEKPNWRLSCLSGSSNINGVVSSVFTDTYIGKWSFNQGVSPSVIQTADQSFTSEGWQMIYLSSTFGDCNAIWAENIVPLERSCSVTGSTTGFKDNSRSQSQVDALVQTFMMRHGIRYAQLAIGKNGNILMERAYSWTESGQYQVQPTDMMLLASLSKMFCAAAIQTLVDAGMLTLQTRPWNNFRPHYPWLGGPPTNEPLQIQLREITIQQLLDHQGGWDRSKTPDLIFQMRQAALDLGKSSPPNISEFVDWITRKQRLDFLPGRDSQYSNVGYLVLSSVVEHVTGMAYFDYLDSAVLTPLGLSGSVKRYETAFAAHANDDVTQESIFTGPSVLFPQSTTILDPNVFGGDGLYKETAVGPSSLASSASTLVKFMNSHSVWGNGPRCNHDTSYPPSGPPLGSGHPCNRDGSMDGARGWAESRSDGLDWAIILNTRDFAGDEGDIAFVNWLAGGISAFLDTKPVA